MSDWWLGCSAAPLTFPLTHVRIPHVWPALASLAGLPRCNGVDLPRRLSLLSHMALRGFLAAIPAAVCSVSLASSPVHEAMAPSCCWLLLESSEWPPPLACCSLCFIYRVSTGSKKYHWNLYLDQTTVVFCYGFHSTVKRKAKSRRQRMRAHSNSDERIRLERVGEKAPHFQLKNWALVFFSTRCPFSTL